MTKRIISIIIAVIMLIPVSVTGFAAELPDYIPQEYFDLADTIADAAREYKTSVKLGDSGISSDSLNTVMMIVISRFVIV